MRFNLTERKITIGTDQEYFLRKKSTKELISAIPHIKGGKHDPIVLPCGSNLQSDNVAVEFAITPATTHENFVDKIRATFSDTMKALPDGTDLSVVPSAEFDPKELTTPEAMEFGCSPDFCAWDVIMNPQPEVDNPNFRSCGGHVHVGGVNADGEPLHADVAFLTEPSGEGKLRMIRAMDTFHGIISTIFDHSDASIARRELYGKAGSHRPTEYGVEYRALSNWWTKTPYSSMLISSLTDDVVEVIITGELDGIIEKIGEKTVRGIINEGDVEQAKIIVDGVLMAYMSEDSKFYFYECQKKLEKSGNIAKEWAIS